MKKLILLVLLLPSLCFAQDLARLNTAIVGGGVAAAAASCTIDTDTLVTTDYTTGVSTGVDTSKYSAQRVSISASTTITEYKINLCSSGEGTIVVELWSNKASGCPNTSPCPNAVVADTVVTMTDPGVACATLSVINFDLTTPKSGVATETYWIVKRNGTGSASTSYKSLAGSRVCYGETGSDWTCTADLAFQVAGMGCQP